jgi:hypothetical protein
MSKQQGAFEQVAEASLAALGAKPTDDALDAWSDPAGAARALGELGEQRGQLVLRAEREPAADASATEPALPWWILVIKGSAEIRACRADATRPEECETRRVTRVVVESAPLPDGADGAVARLALALDRKGGPASTRLLVAEAWARTEGLAVGRLRLVAGRLSRALSVPASLPAASASSAIAPASAPAGDAAEDPEDAAPAPHVSARALARFVLRSEGSRLVLRDFASRGPREGAGLHLVIGLVFAALAAGAWVMLSRSAGAQGLATTGSIAWLGGSVLLTLAAVAFLGVAQFSLRYAAASAPLVAIGAGKVTVAPWVSRGGAVVPEPEGRFGAAIDLGEVRGVSVQDRKGQHALEFATEHGPIDALLTDDPTIARYLAAALARAVDDLRPESTPNARQRARARAAASG